MNSPEWQTQLATIRERTQYAYDKSLFCDVKFTVVDSSTGEKVTISANKYLLAVSSPVFEKMFYGDLAEKQDSIDIPDCTKESLQELLRYVYSDEVNLTRDNVMELLYIANKYDMPFLCTKCRGYLQNTLMPEEAFDILYQAQTLSDEKLEKICWKIIDDKTQSAISSKQFLKISKEMLCQVLARDSLSADELEIFKAVDKWVSKRIKDEGRKSNGKSKRAILGEEVIKLIRFPLICHEELAEVVMPSDILKKREIIELFQIKGRVTPSTAIFKGEMRGGEELEHPVWTEVRFSNIADSPIAPLQSWRYTSNKIDAVNFKVSQPASLFGVRLFGSGESTYKVELDVLENDKVLSSLSSSFDSEIMADGLYYGFNATLDKPVRLDPNVSYTLKALIYGPNSQRGEYGECFVHVCDDLKVTYEDSNLSSNGTSVDRGQFPSLLLLSKKKAKTPN